MVVKLSYTHFVCERCALKYNTKCEAELCEARHTIEELMKEKVYEKRKREGD